MAVLLGTSPAPAADGNGSTPSDKSAEESNAKANDDVGAGANESSSAGGENAAPAAAASAASAASAAASAALPPAAASAAAAADSEPTAKPAVTDEPRQQPRAPHGPADNSETDSADEIGASNVANAETNVVNANPNPNLHSNGSVGQVCY